MTLFTYSLPSWCQTSSVNFLHLLWSVVSSLFNLHAWWSFFTAFLKVPFGLPLGLGPSASYVIHFFTQSSSSHNTCPYHCNLLVMLSILNLSLNSLVQNLSFYLNAMHPFDHSYLCSLKCYLIFFPYRPGLTSLCVTGCYSSCSVYPRALLLVYEKVLTDFNLALHCKKTNLKFWCDAIWSWDEVKRLL